jgi:hypothetical protein
VALVNATKVQSRQQFGDIEGATAASKSARTWCIVSLVVWLISLVVGIALVAGGAFDTNTTYDFE